MSKMKTLAKIVITLYLFSLLVRCSKSNNLLLGRVQEKVGSHVVIVTDCYRTSVPPSQILKADDGKPLYRFTPCRDADIIIHDEQLTVNGIRYETLSPGDTVIVDHGQVVVNTRRAERAENSR